MLDFNKRELQGYRQNPMAKIKFFSFWFGKKKRKNSHIVPNFYPPENPTTKQPKISFRGSIEDLQTVRLVVKERMLELGSKKEDLFWDAIERYLVELKTLRTENKKLRKRLSKQK